MVVLLFTHVVVLLFTHVVVLLFTHVVVLLFTHVVGRYAMTTGFSGSIIRTNDVPAFRQTIAYSSLFCGSVQPQMSFAMELKYNSKKSDVVPEDPVVRLRAAHGMSSTFHNQCLVALKDFLPPLEGLEIILILIGMSQEDESGLTNIDLSYVKKKTVNKTLLSRTIILYFQLTLFLQTCITDAKFSKIQFFML